MKKVTHRGGTGKNIADTTFKCPKHDTSRGYWILLMCED